MKKQIIETNTVPAAIGPYSLAVKTNQMVYFSGQVGLEPVKMELVEGGISAQAEQAFKNIEALTKACDATLDNIVKLTIFLVHMSDFPIVNEIMGRLFKAPYPARSTVAVAALPKNALIEIEAILAL